MRDKHINVTADTALLKQIHAEVDRRLGTGNQNIRPLLFIKFIVYFSLLSLLYVSIFTTGVPALLVLYYILFGLISVLFGFNFAHDFSHNTVFKNKALNNFCFTAIYTMVGAHAEAWKHRHIHSHHYAPNVKDYDSDLQITSLIRVEPGSDHKWFHRYQHFYAPFLYTTYSLYWVLIKDFVIYFTDRSFPPKRSMSHHLSFWIQKFVYFTYLLVLPLLFADFSWHMVLISFIAMHLVQSVFLLFTFFMTHHVEKTVYFPVNDQGYINTSWMNNQVRSSNDFYPFSKSANFIFGGFNNHIAHHLFPHIHHAHYPLVSKIIYRVLREHNIEPNFTGFFGGMRSHLAHLRNMSNKRCKGNCSTCSFSRHTPVKLKPSIIINNTNHS
jgi:linoleoyl-CoA desaturase